MNESKKKLTFELSPEQLRIKTLLNKEFLAVDIMAISNIYPNRNKSYFTEDSMRNAIPTFYEKPILGSFSAFKDDFGGHDNRLVSDEYGVHEDHVGGRYEVPLGLVRTKDRVELIEKDGLKWISLSAALWVNYSYRQVKKLLKSKGKRVSVEVEVTKSHVDNDGIEVIDEFSLMGITILGSDYTEAIPNANISIPELEGTEAYQMRKKSLTFAYQELDKSLGITPESNDNVNIDKSNFSDTPINNEDTDEIKMDNDERGGETVPMYTLEEKRQMLQAALANEDHCVWVVDVSDTDVYYMDDGNSTFSAPYSIEVDEDGNNVVSVDESAKQLVVRSWKKYDESEAEAEKENFEEKKTDEPEKEKESTENKEVEAEDNKEEESTNEKKEDESAEEKECESCEPEDECKMSEDGCKMSEDGCECESKEECAENSDEENKECESAPEYECKMSENDECKMSEDECKMSEYDKDDKDEDDDSDEDKKEEESAESAGAIEKCSEEIPNEPVKEQVVFTVGDKTYTEDEFKAEFIKMSEIIADYEAKFTAAKNAEIYSFVCSVIDSEEDLTAENKDIIKNAMKENCDKSSYSANETAQEAAEHLIADALYQQKKMAKSSKVDKDFSVSIIKETSTVVANTAKNSMEDLKNAIANLNKI
nr:MAG TPA: hypothetical protein [Caudoviricetes sp.]